MPTLAGIGEAIATRLAWAGLGQMYDEARFALLVRGAYQGKARSAVVEKLANELQRAIGNSGDLKEPIGSFLEALSQSGLMASMSEAAALYPLEDTGAVRIQPGHLAAFTALFKQYGEVDESVARR